MSELNKDPYDLFELFGLQSEQASNNSNKVKPIIIKKKFLVKKKKIKNKTVNFNNDNKDNDPGNDGDNELYVSDSENINHIATSKNTSKIKIKTNIRPKINEEPVEESESDLDVKVSDEEESEQIQKSDKNLNKIRPPVRSNIKQQNNKLSPIKVNQNTDKQYTKKIEISKQINYSQEEDSINKKATKALTQMKNGTRVFKCTSSGAPHFRTIKLALDNSHIYWYPDEGDEDTWFFGFFNKNPEDRILHMNDINTVVLGQNTKKFYEAKFSLYTDTSLSIVYGNNFKTLDLIFPIKEDFEIWLLGLRFLRKNF